MPFINGESGDHLNALCHDFALGTLQESSLVTTWLANINYVLNTSSGDFFVKEFREYDEWVLENLLYIEKKLSENGILTPEIIYSQHGNPIYDWNGTKFLVTRKIEWVHPHAPIDKEICFIIWRTLAQFHSCLNSLPNRWKNSILNLFNRDELIRLIHLSFGTLWSPDKWLIDRIRKIDVDGLSALTDCIIHWDFHKENVLLVSSSSWFKIGVLDFELTDFGPSLYDMARSMIDFCSDWNKMNRDKIITFMSGYSSVRHLQAKDLWKLDEFIFLSICCLLLWSLQRWFVDFSKELFTLLKTEHSSNVK